MALFYFLCTPLLSNQYHTMKKRFLLLTTLFFTNIAAALADIDVTHLYLQNGGFDDAKHFDYKAGEFGNVAQEILPIYGWSKDISVDYTITGIYEYGTQKTFNTSGTVPSAGYQGSKGGCLALSTGWDQSLKLYQQVTLPAGTYKLQAPFFNGSNSTNGYSLLGWIPSSGNASLSRLSEFPMNWTLDEVAFTLSSAQEGKVQIGFKGAPNGSANSAKVVVDYVRLILVGDDQTILSNMRLQLQKTVAAAQSLLDQTLYEAHRSELNSAISEAENWIVQPDLTQVEVIGRLNNAYAAAKTSAEAFSRLEKAIEQGDKIYEEGKKGSEALYSPLLQAKYVVERETYSTDEVNLYTRKLEDATFTFQIENASGNAPKVTTDPRHTRGATMAFGRATFAGNDIIEKGFCWATHANPSILDNRSTLSYSNNGDIYVIKDLTPASIYYMRPYAISRANTVGYGERIKICTLPKGEVTWSYNNGGSDEENRRINSAVGDACDIWNNITSIKGLHLTVNYGANTPTADCSYGGWMRVGPNASYQRTGTIQHEMAHAIGVGTTDTWYNSDIYRQSTSSGFWLGERTDQVLHFLENDNTAQLRGDKTHFWPYGINGAHEDDGSRMLYYANALIVQSLGEDNLPPVAGAFASPAYTFVQEDYETYYILSASDALSMPTMLRMDNGSLSLKSCDWRDALKEEGYGWKVKFNPTTQLYEVRNEATEKALSHNGKLALVDSENFQIQLMGSRQNISNSYFNLKSYWMVFADGSNQPMSLTANGNAASVSRFNHQNSATQQRWVILSKAEVRALSGDYTAIDQTQANNHHYIVYHTENGITIETFDKGQWMTIHTVKGELVSQFYQQPHLSSTQTLAPGIYLVNGEKVLVK